VNLERRFRVSDGGVRVSLRRQGLEDALDLDPRGRPESVAGD
jgi:hypothetical protein